MVKGQYKNRIDLFLYLISWNFVLRITGVIRQFQLSKFMSAVSQRTLGKGNTKNEIKTYKEKFPFDSQGTMRAVNGKISGPYSTAGQTKI